MTARLEVQWEKAQRNYLKLKRNHGPTKVAGKKLQDLTTRMLKAGK